MRQVRAESEREMSERAHRKRVLVAIEREERKREEREMRETERHERESAE